VPKTLSHYEACRQRELLEEESKRHYFYCARFSKRGNGMMLVKQHGVARITEEMCTSRLSRGKCPHGFKIQANCPAYKGRDI
jgi:hypothetical protein